MSQFVDDSASIHHRETPSPTNGCSGQQFLNITRADDEKASLSDNFRSGYCPAKAE
jgi:hypothetical protein